MAIGVHSCLAFVIITTLYLSLISSQKVDKLPEWKDGADALSNKYLKNKTEGEDLKLSCPAKGRPKPGVEWKKDGELFFPRIERIRMKGANIKFTHVEPSDRGNYTCLAKNRAGELEFTFVVEVIDKIWPLEANVSSNQTVYEGEDARFYCIVTNDNAARIQWMRIKTSEDIGARPSHKNLDPQKGQSPEILIIHDVRKEDEGQYTCLLGNQWGSKYHHMYLIVNELTTTTTSTTTTTTTPTTTTTTSTTTSTTTTSTTTTPSTTSTTVSTTTTAPMRITTTEKQKKKKKEKKKKNKNRKNKKNNKKKNKNRDKDRKTDLYDNEVNTIGQYDPKDPYNPYHTDFNPNLYNNYNNGFPDDSYNTNTDMFEPTRNNYDDMDNSYMDEDETYSETDQQGGKNETAQQTTTKSSISVWTVYIIVGSVAGGILLAGLVAIAIALCCQKEEDSQYKSTSV